MRLGYIYVPVADLDAALAYYRDVMGFTEAWREAEEAIALSVPGSDVLVMLATDGLPAGPMYEVDDVAEHLATVDGLTVTIPPFEIPGGAVAGLTDPAGVAFYLYDQAARTEE